MLRSRTAAMSKSVCIALWAEVIPRSKPLCAVSRGYLRYSFLKKSLFIGCNRSISLNFKHTETRT